MKKILITGGTGFVGKHLIAVLKTKAYDIHVLSRNTKSHKDNNHVSYYHCDISKQKDVDKVVSRINPDITVHLAADGVNTFTTNSQANTYHIIQTNINGFINLLRALEKSSCRLFINTGSSYEYGYFRNKCSEDTTPKPNSIYSLSKYVTTSYAHSPSSKPGRMKFITLRPASIYGPGEKYTKLIPTFTRQITHNIPPAIPSIPIIHDFIFIDDLIDVYLIILNKWKTIPAGIYNLGSGRGYSLTHIARLMTRLLHKQHLKPIVGGFPVRYGEIPYMVGDTHKIRSTTGWKPKTTLKAGIQKTIEWLINNEPESPGTTRS